MGVRVSQENEFQLQYGQNPSILCPRQEISRFLAHYEIFKLALNVPGSIAEVGVFKGASLLSWVHFLSILTPGDTSRKVYGFDNFSGFTSVSDRDLGNGDKDASDIQIGGWNPAEYYPSLLENIERVERGKMLPTSKCVHLIEGDIAETAATFNENYPGTRFALLHLDIDLYEPTLSALQYLYPLVSPGGIVIVDEFALAQWGASEALDDYFGGKLPMMRKLNHYTNPGGYFVKE